MTFKYFGFSTLALALGAVSTCACAAPLDPRLVGEWSGDREADAKCSFLSWRTALHADGTFAITFFRDKEKTQKIQTETGTWDAINGQSVLKTAGVPTPEIYTYSVVSNEQVKYVNVKRDPSADCQADYEFTETRIKP